MNYFNINLTSIYSHKSRIKSIYYQRIIGSCVNYYTTCVEILLISVLLWVRFPPFILL